MVVSWELIKKVVNLSKYNYCAYCIYIDERRGVSFCRIYNPRLIYKPNFIMLIAESGFLTQARIGK